MSDSAVSDDGRYWAFVSYSHKDAAFGRRLHRRLEAYALPRRLVGRVTAKGSVPRRLAPIFRDREELPAANDLSAEVRAALQVSRSLIVVCSPAAAASPWVAREVELFRELHPGRPVLAAIREGEPEVSIPEVLRRTGPAGASLEPLAADFRRGHDGWELGLLKLVAGMLGVGLDELVQRNSQRRTQRVTAVTAGALAAMLVMGVLTAFALSARSEAERQRAEAEGLVKFMHTDLHDGLKSVGRLDLMYAVDQRALLYYEHQARPLSPSSLAQRARFQQAMGEVDEDRHQHQAALNLFREAWQVTNMLLAQSPNDSERMFDHAQSEYWLGYDDYEQKRFAPANMHFLDYKRLADLLVAIAPSNPRYIRELAYAEGDLCTIPLEKPRNPPEAIRLCAAALAHMERAARGKPALVGTEADLANRHSWLGSAYLVAGDKEAARAQFLVQEQMLDRLMTVPPPNMKLKSGWIAVQRLLAWFDWKAGHPADGLARLARAMSLSDQMIAFDPSNKAWATQRADLDGDAKKIQGH